MRCTAHIVLITGWLSACAREDATNEARVSGPRILAVLADPAEAAPGEQVHYRALLVAADGPHTGTRVRWSLCQTPRAQRENGSVSAACADRDEQPLETHELELDAIIPRDACARFGSETALGQRPLDPDHTGGYYQPLRLSVDDLPSTIVRQRITCPLSNAPIDVAQRFNQRYTPNQAPAIAALRIFLGDEELSADALPAHAKVRLELTLAQEAREIYPLYDALHGRLGTAREQLDVRWYTTSGELSSDNELSTPGAGAFWLWLVVRDDRGGVSALEQPVRVIAD